MKRIEIDECSEQCPWLKGNGTFCYITRRSITGFNKRTGFPDWCPLPDVEGKSDNISRCDVCGNKFEAHESGFCPYCNTGYISKQ